MEIGCCLWWVEDILQRRHPTVTVVDTNCDTSVLGDSCSNKECLLSLVNVQLELPVLLQSTLDINHWVLTMTATQTSHTRHQPLGPNNDSNRDVTHKTSTTVSDNDNTETSHTRHQPLGPDNDSNTYVTYKTTTTVSDNDSNTDVTYKTTNTVSDNDSNTDITYKTTTTVSDNDSNTDVTHKTTTIGADNG